MGVRQVVPYHSIEEAIAPQNLIFPRPTIVAPLAMYSRHDKAQPLDDGDFNYTTVLFRVGSTLIFFNFDDLTLMKVTTILDLTIPGSCNFQ